MPSNTHPVLITPPKSNWPGPMAAIAASTWNLGVFISPFFSTIAGKSFSTVLKSFCGFHLPTMRRRNGSAILASFGLSRLRPFRLCFAVCTGLHSARVSLRYQDFTRHSREKSEYISIDHHSQSRPALTLIRALLSCKRVCFSPDRGASCETGNFTLSRLVSVTVSLIVLS